MNKGIRSAFTAARKRWSGGNRRGREYGNFNSFPIETLGEGVRRLAFIITMEERYA